MTKERRDTTPAGNIFPDFLKRDPMTVSNAADIPIVQNQKNIGASATRRRI
jgi:hypothetical protein